MLIVYAALIVFSFGYQFIRRKYFAGDANSSSVSGSDEPEVQNEDPQLGSNAQRRGRKDKINESAISSNMSRVENSAQRLLEGGRRDD